jgi:hypothetical protein
MISAFQFEQMQARCAAGRGVAVPAVADAVSDEGGLHDEILAECRRRLWPAVHSRMDMATTQGKGTPDFCIAADGGRTFWIECKTAKGKLTPEQIGWRMMLQRNGHKYAVVRSMTEFFGAVETWLHQ